MNQFTTFALLICALVATVNCVGPIGYPVLGAELVRGGSVAVAGSSVANSPAKIVTGPIPAVWSPVGHGGGYGVGLAAPLGIASRRTLLAPGLGSLGVGHGRGLVPRVIAQPVASTIINPGPIRYKAYVSPPEYSRVVLPVRAADAVAKLWVPQGKTVVGHGGHGGYGAPLAAVH